MKSQWRAHLETNPLSQDTIINLIKTADSTSSSLTFSSPLPASSPSSSLTSPAPSVGPSLLDVHAVQRVGTHPRTMTPEQYEAYCKTLNCNHYGEYGHICCCCPKLPPISPGPSSDGDGGWARGTSHGSSPSGNAPFALNGGLGGGPHPPSVLPGGVVARMTAAP